MFSKLTVRDRPKSSTRARKGPIGFELSHEKLHILQMQHGSGVPKILAAASIPHWGSRDEVLSSKTELRSLVNRALRCGPFAGRRIVACIPADSVTLAHVSYRFTDHAQEQATIAKLALERVGGEQADWVMDFVPVHARGADERDRAALVACARTNKVIDYLEALRRAKLQVAALEIGPLSIQRLVTSTSSGENVLALNFGNHKTFLTMYSKQRLSLEREVPFGEAEVVRTVGASLDMAADESRDLLYRYGVSSARSNAARGAQDEHAGDVSETVGEIVKPRFLDLAAEIEKVIIYTASQMRGAAVDCVFLLGSVARWPGAEALLNELLSLPVRVLNPFSAFETSSEVAVQAELDPIAGIAIATGCALRRLPS